MLYSQSTISVSWIPVSFARKALQTPDEAMAPADVFVVGLKLTDSYNDVTSVDWCSGQIEFDLALTAAHELSLRIA